MERCCHSAPVVCRSGRCRTLRRLFWWLIVFAWLVGFLVEVRAILDWVRRHPRRGSGVTPLPSRHRAIDPAPCRSIPRHVYRRPDPMIYCQKYLLGQGLSVTWDNPDIQLELAG